MDKIIEPNQIICLGIVSPCYNEAAVLEKSAQRLTQLLEDLIRRGVVSARSFILYVNDGSEDNTWSIISALHAGNVRINGLDLAHNVGHQNAIFAGMMQAKDICDGVVTIDCDLQDDLAAIEKMIRLHYEGNDIVYGVKVSRNADSPIKKLTAEAFYNFESLLGIETVKNHADFRFMSKRALAALAHFPERNLFLRGVIPMIGFKTALVEEEITSRIAGESKYTLAKMFRLATDGITSFSSKPMTILLLIGSLMLIMSIIILIYVIASIISGHYVPGWSSLLLSIWFVGSIITIGIGLCGIYIGKMYLEVKQRPRYIVAQQLIHSDENVDNGKML